MKFCWIACITAGSGRRIRGGFILKVLLKKSVKKFEHMEIAEYIYEDVLSPSYQKSTRTDVKRAGHRMKMRGEAAS